jgi:hypothetical protein
MWLPNQAGLQAWWSMNSKEPWMQYMQVLYHVVNMGLGERAKDAWVFQHMHTSYFNTAAGITTNLIKNNPVSSTVQNRMWSDPYYGLNNPDNYWRWNQLRVVSKVNETWWNEKLAWQNEIRAAFNLTVQQLSEATQNWLSLYRSTSNSLYPLLPSNSTYKNNFGLMYWQWATGFLSESNWGQPSMANVMPSFYAGWYELSYFKSAYLTSANTAQANVDVFSYVELYNNDVLTSVNYEHLFLTYDIFSNDATTAPPSNSLFDMANMQLLISLGNATPNILKSDQVYGVDFELSDDWYGLTNQLGLDFSQ